MKKLLLAACVAFFISCSKPPKESIAPSSSNVPTADTTVYPSVIYLNFSGGSLRDPYWNQGQPLDLLSSGLTPVQQTEVVNRVARMFSPFSVTVTANVNAYNNAAAKKRLIVQITQSSSWTNGIEVGGSAIDSSFADETSVFVFSALLKFSAIDVAAAAGHEIGHSLNLVHQARYSDSCTVISKTRYGTIMGYPYGIDNIWWTVGPTPRSCSDIQDDIAIISKTLPLK